METKDYLHMLVHQIHTVVVATIDELGLPMTCAMDLMDHDANSVYFLTAQGKSFYMRLKQHPYVSLTGIRGDTTMQSAALTLHGKVREVVDLYHGIGEGVINANHAWWCPEFDQQGRGFDLVSINCVMNPYNQDEICGAETLRSTAVRVYKATPENSPFGNPIPCDNNGNPMIHDASDPRLKDWLPGGPGLQNIEMREGA